MTVNIASVVTTIAFIHKKIRDNNPKNVRIASATQQYESFENAKTVHPTSQYAGISRMPTTMWKSPSTDHTDYS